MRVLFFLMTMCYFDIYSEYIFATSVETGSSWVTHVENRYQEGGYQEYLNTLNKTYQEGALQGKWSKLKFELKSSIPTTDAPPPVYKALCKLAGQSPNNRISDVIENLSDEDSLMLASPCYDRVLDLVMSVEMSDEWKREILIKSYLINLAEYQEKILKSEAREYRLAVLFQSLQFAQDGSDLNPENLLLKKIRKRAAALYDIEYLIELATGIAPVKNIIEVKVGMALQKAILANEIDIDGL